MKNRPYHLLPIRLAAIAGLLCLLPWATAIGQMAGKYTNAKPLIIVGDMDDPPYEFVSTNDRQTGLNVEILDFVLKQMHVPHVFVLKEKDNAANTFEKHEADILLCTAGGTYSQKPYYPSRNSLSFYKFAIVSRVGSTAPKTIKQLNTAKGVVIRQHDRFLKKKLKDLCPDLTVSETTSKDAIIGVYTGKYDFFVWNSSSLEWKAKELGLSTELIMTDLPIPSEEISFSGHDKELIDLIDDQIARLEQHGEMRPIMDKWLHPERKHDDASVIAIYVTTLILLIAIGLMLVMRLRRKRLKVAERKVSDVEKMMRQALSLSKIAVIEFDVKTKRLTNRHGNLLPEKGLSIEEFKERMHPDEQEQTISALQELLDGKKDLWEFRLRYKLETNGKAQWRYLYGYSIAEHDSDGNTCYLVSTFKDVTEEYEQERKDEELTAKYVKMFDSTLVAMSFYDKDGMMIDLNQNMRKLCEFDRLGDPATDKMSFFEMSAFKNDFSPSQRESFHVCEHLNYPETGVNKYIELRILPIYDNDELQFFIITARDVTAERSMYMEQQRQDTELRQKSDTINHYEQELHYLLENSNMWVWRSSLKEKRIVLSRSLKNDEFSQTFDEYLESIDDSYRAEALRRYEDMKGTEKNINNVLLFKSTPINPHPHWCASNGIPIYGPDGKIEGHFGIVRDVTDLMEAQEKLKRETVRAEDSGRLKSVFLANMTHEIRTPLNAIVGFSDLLQMIDSAEERSEFIRIIRNNCDMLIRLINDIIEASNLNQGPLTIEPQKIDFAVAFNDICQTLAQRVQEPGVEFIVDNPFKHFITYIDNGRLQQVITNFTTNAVKYTHHGHIKVGYDYLSFFQLKEKVKDPALAQQTMPFSGIYMYCEDTGAGIPKEKQRAVFERFVKLNDFVQGTGLGLSICKSIADRCAGRIGVMSEGEGKGSTFWIWIPCEHLR